MKRTIFGSMFGALRGALAALALVAVTVVQAAPIVIGSFDGSRSGRPVDAGDYSNMRSALLNASNFGPGGIVSDAISFAAATGTIDAAYLSTINVFFMSEVASLSPAEANALRAFVLAGNKLIMVTDSVGSGAMNDMMGLLDGGSLGGADGGNGTDLAAVVGAGSAITGPFGDLTGGALSASLHAILNVGADTTVLARSVGAGGSPILAEILAGALGAGSGGVLLAGDVLFMNLFWPPGTLFNDADNAIALMNFLATDGGSSVPEPATIVLLGISLIGVRLLRRRG